MKKTMKVLRGIGFFLSTLAIYLGVPLLGWGIDDLGGFFSISQRSGYAVLIIAFGLAVGYQAIDAPEGIRGSQGQAGKRVRRQSIVRVVVVLLMYGAFIFLPLADRRSLGVMRDSQVVRWSGLVLFGFGCALIFWSGVALGRMYSAEVTIQKNHHLITTGLYRYLRHPRYLGVIVFAIGLSLLFRSWAGLAVSVPLLIVLLLRIRDEDALMHEEFGQEWETYCKQSWRLIPFLY
jgi:protein-S-isoprenylcysteine O-methyltransferase Ste14